jgi:glycerol-3-phosphate acyltransferase PlsY
MILLVLAYVGGAVPTGHLVNRHLWMPLLLRLAPRRAYNAGHQRARALVTIVISGTADFVKGFLVMAALSMLYSWLLTTTLAWTTRPLFSVGVAQVAMLIALVVGHALSVYICGWGGRGIATALGAFLVIMPQPALICLGVFAVAAALTRRVWVGSLAATLALPLLIWYYDHAVVLFIVAAVLLFIYSCWIHAVDLAAAARRHE